MYSVFTDVFTILPFRFGLRFVVFLWYVNSNCSLSGRYYAQKKWSFLTLDYIYPVYR